MRSWNRFEIFIAGATIAAFVIASVFEKTNPTRLHLIGFGTAYFYCILGAIAYLIALIIVDWMRSGSTFVIESLVRYALAFVISLVSSPVLILVYVMVVAKTIMR